MARLINVFKHMFSVFKQHYIYFHIFYPHVFPKNTNTVTRITPILLGSMYTSGNQRVDLSSPRLRLSAVSLFDKRHESLYKKRNEILICRSI